MHPVETVFQSDFKQDRDGSQLEELFDLLPDDLYEVVADLPYSSRALIKRWYERESDRLEPLMSRMVGGVQHRTPAVMELLDLVASESIDLQRVGNWLKDHRNEMSAQLLVELVSAAMGYGVTELMCDRAEKRQGKNREKKAEALRLWNEEYKDKPRMSKENAAKRIADDVGLAAGTVRRYLRGL